MATANDILKLAQAELGVKEEPAGSNRVKYNTWYYGREVSGDAYPWCMAFVQWVFQQADAAALLPVRTVSCGALMQAAQSAGLWVTSGYKPGDVIIYDFPGGAKTDHTGILESITGETIVTLEGNTGVGNDANGGSVMRRNRAVKLAVGAVRPAYLTKAQNPAPEKNTPPTPAKPVSKPAVDNTPASYATEAVAWAQKAGILQGDGEGNLKLKETVTREQLMVFLHRALQPDGTV